MKSSQRLTAIETSFVALEQPAIPMHVGGLVMLDGIDPLTLHELQRLVSTRLKTFERFHQELQSSPGGWPVWRPAGRIKPSAHFFHHLLARPGRDSMLYELCAAIHEEALDRDQPLWEMHLIDGVSGRRQALLVKTHHAIADGVAGIEIAEKLFDPAPGAARPEVPVMRFAGGGVPSPWLAAQGLVGLAFTLAGGPIANDGPFNGPVSGRRAFATATLPMSGVKQLKRELGASIDDVLAATVAAGLARYLREAAYPRIPSRLRAMLPVSTRGVSCRTSTQNHVSAVFIDLPMHAGDLTGLVREIAEAKATLRTAHAAAGGAMAVEALAQLPAPVHGAIVKLVSGLPFANLVFSDVPGPDQELNVLGRRVLACYPMMPLAPAVGLSIASTGMGGVIGVGVTADPLLVPDVRHLAAAIQHAWAAFESRPTARRHAA